MAIAPGHHVVKRSGIDNPICASVLMPPVTFNPIPPSTSVDPVTRNPFRIMVRIVNVVPRIPNMILARRWWRGLNPYGRRSNLTITSSAAPKIELTKRIRGEILITGSAVPRYVQDPHAGDAVSSSHGDADIGDKSCAYPPTLSACRVAQRPGRLCLGPRARRDRQG